MRNEVIIIEQKRSLAARSTAVMGLPPLLLPGYPGLYDEDRVCRGKADDPGETDLEMDII